MNDETVISDRLWEDSGMWIRELIVAWRCKLGVLKLRFYVRDSPHTRESYASVAEWRAGWIEVHRIAGARVVSRVHERDSDSVTVDQFTADVAELRRVARAVLT